MPRKYLVKGQTYSDISYIANQKGSKIDVVLATSSMYISIFDNKP